MDTTAAAELGGGVVEGGVGYWDGAGVGGDAEGWAEKGSGEVAGQGGGGGGVGWGRGGSHGRGSRPPGASDIEPPPKRMRNMGGEGTPHGSGSGNYNNYGPGQNAGHGGGNAGGAYGSGSGGSPGLKGNFASGSSGYGPGGLGPPPGTPSGDSAAGGSGQGGMSRGRGMGSIFYKTKLCSRFRNGNCPYNTNCNFAHGMEELRKPPPGWEDVVAAQENGAGTASASTSAPAPAPAPAAAAAATAAAAAPPSQAPGQVSNGGGGGGERGGGGGGNAAGSSRGDGGAGGGGGRGEGGGNVSDMQRFHKTRPCKKYLSELGCPYGDRCNFLHDEQSPQLKAARESVVVTVTTNSGASGSVAGAAAGSSGGGGAGTTNQRPPNWKTRLCNKWETTGNCPFGEKCHFAHGTAELQRYGGGPVDPSSSDGAGGQMDPKFRMSASGSQFADGDEGFLPSLGEGYAQVPNARQPSNLYVQQNLKSNQGSGTGFKSTGNWKGPTDGISTIYGDWVEEEEWENPGGLVVKDSQRLGQVSQKGVEYSPNEPSLPREKAGPIAAFGRYSNGQDMSGQRPSLNQGHGFQNAGRIARVYAQEMQGVDVGSAAQERGPETKYNGTQGWGNEL